MKNFLKMAVLAVMVCSLSACCACRKGRKGVDKPLAGTVWQLTQLDGRAVEATGDQFTLTFGADGRVVGRGACNRIAGGYVAGETGTLKLTPAAMTRMMCLDGAETEAAFTKALAGATHFKVEGDVLMLLADGAVSGLMQAR